MKIVKKFPKKFIIPSVVLVILLVSGIAFAINVNNKPQKVSSVSTAKSNESSNKKQSAEAQDVKKDIQPIAEQERTTTSQASDQVPQTQAKNEPVDSPEVSLLKSYGISADTNTMSTALAMTSVGNKAGMKISYARAYTGECQTSQLAMIGCVNDYVNQAYSGSWANAIQAYATVTARGQGSW